MHPRSLAQTINILMYDRNIVHCKDLCKLLATKNSTEDIFRMRWCEASGSHNLALLSSNYDKLFNMKAV